MLESPTSQATTPRNGSVVTRVTSTAVPAVVVGSDRSDELRLEDIDVSGMVLHVGMMPTILGPEGG